MEEDFHATKGKKSENADDDWAYIDDGFEAEMTGYENLTGEEADVVGDIMSSLSTWRISLNDNMVLDDMMSKSHNVPTADAYGDLMKNLDRFDEVSNGWSPESQSIKQSVKNLKRVATRLNETMMKTSAEVYSDIDEHTSYRDLTEIAKDPVGYKLKHAIKRQNKRIFERYESFDDEIRGEKDTSRVVAAFLPQGEKDTWTAQEKDKCEKFIKDYASEDAVKRRPYLWDITNQMMDLAISLEMYTQDYLSSHVEDMAFFMTQLSYFEDIRNDPVNADFFRLLPEKSQKKLDVINRIATSFTPGDFIKNVDRTLKRTDAYKLDPTDEVRLSTIMEKGAVNQVANEHMYDTKNNIERYKRDRR